MADDERAASRIAETTSLLARLEGAWRGTGAGDYPTIDAFHYDEELRFELDRSYPMIHYEQRTWLVPSREPSHWESGFIRPVDDGSIEVSNSQDSGRVEVLKGLASAGDGDDLTLELEAVVLDHDPRLVRTRRVFTLSGEVLRYVVSMSTTTTPEPRMQQHLTAELRRDPTARRR